MGKKFQKSDQPTIEREKKNIFIISMKTKIKKGKELVVHFVATKTGQKNNNSACNQNKNISNWWGKGSISI